MAFLAFSSTTFTVVGLFLVLGYFLYRAALPRPIPGIPFHKKSANSLLGDALPMLAHAARDSDRTINDWMVDQARELNSPIFQLFIFPFKKPMVFLMDHREAVDILLRRNTEFDRSALTADALVGTLPNSHAIMQTSDPRFKGQRRLLTDTMAPEFLQKVAAKHVYQQSLNMMDLWRVKSRMADGRPFAIDTDISEMALDAIWAVAFGSDIDTVKTQTMYLEQLPEKPTLPTNPDQSVVLPRPELPESYKAITVLVHDLEVAAHSPFPRQAHWVRRQTRRWKRAKAHEDKLIQDRLLDAKKRLLDPESREDMVDCALDHLVYREQQAALREGREPQYDTSAAKDEVFTFLFTGHETTGTALTWAVKHIADNPAVQSRLRSDLQSAYPDYHKTRTIPTAEVIAKANIPYLDAVMEEVLRVARVASGQVRNARCDTVVLGYRIPKGVDVAMPGGGPGLFEPNPFHSYIQEKDRSQSSQDAKHKDVPDWDESDIGVFKPERWMKTGPDGSQIYDAQAGPSRPFGAGIRGCFGRKLAYLELRIVITVMIWCFELPRLPASLSSYKPVLAPTRKPVMCFGQPRWLLGDEQRRDSTLE